MKKITLILLSLAILPGCGSALKEVKEYPPVITKTVSKEPFCVYNKLHKTAIEHPMSQQSTSCFGRWQSTWDPTSKSGEIFTGEPWDVIMLFQINSEEKTIIDAKMEEGIRYCPSQYKSLAHDILSSADFSGCPDIP